MLHANRRLHSLRAPGLTSECLFIPGFATVPMRTFMIALSPWTLKRIGTSSIYVGRSGGVVVKFLACGASGRRSIPGFAAKISEIGYLLLLSRYIAEISLKRLKS